MLLSIFAKSWIFVTVKKTPLIFFHGCSVCAKCFNLNLYQINRSFYNFFILIGDEVQIQEIIDELQNIKTQSRSNERRSCMTQLIRLTRDGNCVVIKEKFRYVITRKKRIYKKKERKITI